MPEGHKTHFIARRHRERMAGQRLKVTSPQGRFCADAKKVSGRILETVEAAGKRIFYVFEGDRIVHVHLGRYGKFRELDSPPPAPVGQVRMRMFGETSTVDLTGPTTCCIIDAQEKRELIDRLGPDPLAGGKKSDVWRSVSQSGKPIAALLLDQAIIAGVGNIFRAEVLFETRIDPSTPGNVLSKSDFDKIWKSLTKMMKVGLKYGRIISVTVREAGMPLADIDGKYRFRIYGKQTCPRCGSDIKTIEIGSRKLYVCEQCQGIADRRSKR